MAKGITHKEFEDCLSKNKIVKFSSAKKLVRRELTAAEDDLKTASVSLKNQAVKWATIQAYYSMFHTARALLYAKGYREKSHYCLIVAMKVLFVSERLLDIQLVEAFGLAKVLRENADYDNEYSLESAKSITGKAQEFIETSKRILSTL